MQLLKTGLYSFSTMLLKCYCTKLTITLWCPCFCVLHVKWQSRRPLFVFMIPKNHRIQLYFNSLSKIYFWFWTNSSKPWLWLVYIKPWNINFKPVFYHYAFAYYQKLFQQQSAFCVVTMYIYLVLIGRTENNDGELDGEQW